MRITLTKIVMATAIMAAAAVTATTVKAETTVKVPFTFNVAGKVCPAGLYTVQEDINRGLVTLKSKSAAQSFTWVLGPGDYKGSGHVTLKFDAAGDKHVLRAVQYQTLTTSDLGSRIRPSERIYSHLAQGQ